MKTPSIGRIVSGSAMLLVAGLASVQGAALAMTVLQSRDAGAWLGAALGLWLGALAADGLTGLVHWACDTWGDESTPWLGPTLIHAFREHHRDPQAMLAHHPLDVSREPMIAAAVALAALCFTPARGLLELHPAAHGFLWSLSVYGAAANQLHFWAHAPRIPWPVRLLQRLRLVLSSEAHQRHHAAPNTRGYCISTGWLNPVLDAAGFWRSLERGVTRLTGARVHSGERGEALE